MPSSSGEDSASSLFVSDDALQCVIESFYPVLFPTCLSQLSRLLPKETSLFNDIFDFRLPLAKESRARGPQMSGRILCFNLWPCSYPFRMRSMPLFALNREKQWFEGMVCCQGQLQVFSQISLIRALLTTQIGRQFNTNAD